MSRIVQDKVFLKRLWLIATAILVVTGLSQSILIGFAFTFLCCVTYLRNYSFSNRLAFFVGLIFVLPNENAVELTAGFYFGYLTYFKILVIGLLLPILLASPGGDLRDRMTLGDYLAVGFVIWLVLLNLGYAEISSILRTTTWFMVDILIPYLVIRFHSRNYNLMFVALSFALMAQCVISIFEGVLGWKLYETFRMMTSFDEIGFSMYKMRHGFLRTEAVFSNPLVLALFANLAFLFALIMFRKIGSEPFNSRARIYALIAMAVAIAATFFTGSRAGLASIGLLTVIYFLADWAFRQKQDPKAILISIGVIGIALVFYLFGDSIQQEFGYRYKLIDVSMELIKSKPIFGDLAVQNDPRLEVLIQGEGFVDIVNTYIYFALHYGIVSVLLFLGAIICGLLGLYSELRRSHEHYLLGAFTFCALLIMTFNLATTSPLGWTYQWVWICLPICFSLANARKREE